ncbi:MAG: TAXI family TRAP transporter solute-binding subunit [Proteobacteria bacterium]|nr:TAXI family TRAP transporter solute-binding subunit [Pseudomonadota bacterium]
MKAPSSARRQARLRNLGLAAIAAIAVGAVTVAIAQEARFLRIGTGGAAGTYYPIGSIIANAISSPPGSVSCEKGGSCGVPGLVAIVQSSEGSIENVEGIGSGALELALSQADIAYWAFHGSGPFRDKGAIADLRAIANLYPETLHIVVRRDAGIAGIADLAGKRVSLGEEDSGTLVEARAVLDAYGISGNDLDHVHLRSGPSSLMMSEGTLDAFFIVAGYPVAAIEELARTVEIDLLPVNDPEADTVVAYYPFLARGVIPAGVYNGVGEAPTISVGAQLLVAAGVDEETVYEITRALWNENTRKLLDQGHARGRDIRLETAVEGIAVPLHPGAERYYREVGVKQ